MLRFNEVWLSDPQFTDWLVKVSNDETRAYCRWCGIVLRAHKTDLTTHAGTTKHNKNALTSVSPQGPISVQIVPKDDERIKQSTACVEQQINFDEMGNPRGTTRSPYTKKYRTVWETIPELKNWLTDYPPDLSKAFCKVCEVHLRAHKHDLMIHARSLKHKKAEEMYMSGTPINGGGGRHFMASNFTDTDDYQDQDDGPEDELKDDSLALKTQDNQSLSKSRNGDAAGGEGNKDSEDSVKREDSSSDPSSSKSQLDDSTASNESNTPKRSTTEMSIIRVPGRLFQQNSTRPTPPPPSSISRKRRLGASDVIEAIEKNDFTGYELLQIVKAAIPKL